MEDDVTIPEINFQMPDGIEIPIKHEQPKTTLDSLLQIKNEFDTKLKESTDASKKRRYQRQLKQFEDAIKATKEGKAFNYSDLVVPPGFAQIPLQNGKPILASSSSQQPRPPSTRPASQLPLLPQPTQTAAAAKPKQETYDNVAELDDSDDIINQLEAEIDENELGDDVLDPEEEKFNRQIQAATSFIPKHLLQPPPDQIPSELLIDDFDPFNKKKPQAQVKPSVKPVQPQVTRPSPAVVQPAPPQQQQVRQPVKPVSPVKPKTQSKELSIILERQRLFKEAALKAKQEGNTSVAIVYLRHAKGFDMMIQAAENGLPLDMSNLPVPPQLADKIKKTSSSNIQVSPNSRLSNAMSSVRIDEDLPVNGDRETVYKYLLKTLKEQVEKATENFKHFTNMGDISNANKFNQLARESIQDLEAVRNAHKLGESVPLYHYEKRTYETVDCNSDLTDNDLELTVIRAINLGLPKDHKQEHMNTFVKFEFPYPPEELQSDKTKVQNATCNPEYNQTFRLQIQRKQSKFVRFINRKELKLEVYLKGGFLRSDKLLYTCQVKLQPLENLSTIHDAFDLLEGRRQTGGKLEIKLRIREPILHKDIKHLEYKLLIIDKFQKATL